MEVNLSKEELVKLVRRIINVNGTEEEINKMINILENNVPHPNVSDLIFYPEKDEVTPEEILEEALSNKAIHL